METVASQSAQMWQNERMHFTVKLYICTHIQLVLTPHLLQIMIAAVQAFKDGDIRFLICTDEAAPVDGFTFTVLNIHQLFYI